MNLIPTVAQPDPLQRQREVPLIAVPVLDSGLSMLLMGFVAGFMARYGATYSKGIKPTLAAVVGDVLTLPIMVIFAAYVVRQWDASARTPVTNLDRIMVAGVLALIGAGAVVPFIAEYGKRLMERVLGPSVGNSSAAPPSDAVSPVNPTAAAKPLTDVRAGPVAQLGARYGSDARQQAGAHGEHDPDQDLVDKLGDAE